MEKMLYSANNDANQNLGALYILGVNFSIQFRTYSSSSFIHPFNINTLA